MCDTNIMIEFVHSFLEVEGIPVHKTRMECRLYLEDIGVPEEEIENYINEAINTYYAQIHS